MKKDNTSILAIDIFCSFSYSANIIPQQAMNEILRVKQGKIFTGWESLQDIVPKLHLPALYCTAILDQIILELSVFSL